MPPARSAWKRRRARGSLAAPGESGSPRGTDAQGTRALMRVFIACLGTETNTFSSLPTGEQTYRDTAVFDGDATRHAPNPFSLPLHIWRERAEAEGTRGHRGPMRLRAAGGADDPPRLRGLSRPHPRAGRGRAAARPGAGQHARRDGGGGLRRLRGGPAGPAPRGRRSRHGDRRRARPALPHHAAHAGGRDGAHHLQGVSPRRYRRAGGRPVPALPRRGSRAHPRP